VPGDKSDNDSGGGGGEDFNSKENEKLLGDLQARVQRINDMEAGFEKLKDAELRAKTAEFRKRLASGEATTDDLLEEAFAVVREAAWRVLELRHYDVQLLGGMVLHQGRLAQMNTGEGKTLAATLPTYLNALEGKGALVVTFNEYLAKRDAETVGQVYRFLGLRVGLVQASLPDDERKEAYAADVTFATNSELGFDYLRDNLATSPEKVVMRSQPPDFCLVDEADSVLIDEARTPLIISKQVPAPKEKYDISAQLAGVLKKDKDYEVDIKGQLVTMTDDGFSTTEKLLGKPMFDPADPWAPFVMNAIKAKELFEKDSQYIVRDDAEAAEPGKREVCIVDTFSGRVMDGRRWSDGLHQSIEAKEGIEVSGESQVIATVTYQSLFRQFPKLCGMSGTATTDAKEFLKVYDLPVTPIPTALPVARRDYPDVVYKTAAAKDRAVMAEVMRAYNCGDEEGGGRPVLVGTTSVEQSELYAAKLRERGVAEVLVLNARPGNTGKESEVVSQAGRLGAVTVATNMAGRGTDILLGGNPSLMAKLRVRDGLASTLALAVAPIDAGEAAEAEAAKAPAADLETRASPRLVTMDAGFYPVEISAEAEALVETAKGLILEDGEFEEALELEEVVSIAAEKAPINDAAVLAIRAAYKQVKDEFASALAPEKAEVRRLGGLYVVGTERHESQRIDDQLRGRAGRQGDPGNSRFFLSLDDKMLRTFGADRMKTVLDSFRVSEDTPLEAAMVTEAIDKVQRKVEEYYFDIREQIFTFDDVLTTQRESIYRRRGELLFGDDAFITDAIREYCAATVADIVPNFFTANAAAVSSASSSPPSEPIDAEGLAAKLAQFFPTVDLNLDVTKIQALGQQPRAQDEVTKYLNQAVTTEALEVKRATIDAIRERQFVRVAQYLALVQIDNGWSEHLKNMNYLKESVVLRRYQGRDVLQEYITEGAELFEEFLAQARRSTVYSLFAYQTPK
jgi:preprotein translocase subunit SecA